MRMRLFLFTLVASLWAAVHAGPVVSNRDTTTTCAAITVTASKHYHPDQQKYHGSNTLTKSCSDNTHSNEDGKTTWWAAPFQATGEDASIVFDLGCSQFVNMVTLHNSPNGAHQDSGTKDFTLWLSEDGKTWSQVVSATLTDVLGVACANQKEEEFTFKSQAARFAKFRAESFYGANQPALEYINVGLKEGKPDQCKAQVAQSKHYHQDQPKYHGSNTLTKSCSDNTHSNEDGKTTWWAAPFQATGEDASIVFDLGCSQFVNMVTLHNSPNGAHQDSGTKDFTLWLSEDGKTWSQVVSATLTDVLGVACANQKEEEFTFKSQAARFAKFRAESFYGANQPALEYINVGLKEGKPDQCEAQVARSKHYQDRQQYHGSNTLTKSCSDSTVANAEGSTTWWAANLNATGEDASIVFDLGCTKTVNKATLHNSPNGASQDSGTKDFTLWLSEDGKAWSQVVSAILTDVLGVACANQKEEVFTFEAKTARFAKFRAESFYGTNQPALEYIKVSFREDKCLDGWFSSADCSRKCYKALTDGGSKTYDEAVQACPSASGRSSAILAEPATATEFECMSSGLQSGQGSVWIGVNDKETEGTFKYQSTNAAVTDGTLKFKSGQPDNWDGGDSTSGVTENCIGLVATSGFSANDYFCAKDKLVPLCQYTMIDG